MLAPSSRMSYVVTMRTCSDESVYVRHSLHLVANQAEGRVVWPRRSVVVDGAGIDCSSGRLRAQAVWRRCRGDGIDVESVIVDNACLLDAIDIWCRSVRCVWDGWHGRVPLLT